MTIDAVVRGTITEDTYDVGIKTVMVLEEYDGNFAPRTCVGI